MSFENEAIKAIIEHFNAKQQQVADVLAGPRREGWFNAESFVALNAISTCDTFTVYGEQCYSNIPECLTSRRIPDLDGYVSEKKVAFLIEAKLLFRRDNETKRRKLLHRLVTQLQEGKQRCPKVPVVGLLHLACLSSDPTNHKRKGANRKVEAGVRITPDRFCKKIAGEIEAELKEFNPVWLQSPRMLTQQDTGQPTSFAYPSVHVWFGIGAIAI